MEIFAGTSRLTAAVRQLGLRDSFGIDHVVSDRLVAPIVQLDLSIPENFSFLQDIIREPGCIYVHFAPPCGTASRARFIKRRGRHNPPVLRTDDHPNGLPHLSPLHAAKVAAANLLYDQTQVLRRLCVEHGVLFSIENPARSFMWQTTHMAKFLEEVAHYKTYFHHCMYGSARRKHTCFVHSIPTLCDLAALCDNSHVHEAWGYSSTGWATAEETAYPWPVCRKVAALVPLHIQTFGVTCPTPTFATHTSQLDAIRQQTLTQVSKGLPWVSEFKEIIQVNADTPVPANARALSTPAVGHIASAKKKTLGVYRTPEEFIHSALEAKHPGHQSDDLPEPMKEALQFCAAHTDEFVGNSRSESLRAMIAKAQQLGPSEQGLKADSQNVADLF